MNIKKFKKLIKHPKQFILDSKVFKSSSPKKNKEASIKKLCFLLVGENKELLEKTLQSIKVAETKCTITEHVIEVVSSTKSKPAQSSLILKSFGKFNANDYVKIMLAGEEINKEFLSEYYRKSNFSLDDDIILHAYATDISTPQPDPIFANIKNKISKDHSPGKDYIFPYLSTCIIKNNILLKIADDLLAQDFNESINNTISALSESSVQHGYQFLPNAYQGQLTGERIELKIQDFIKSEKQLSKTLDKIKEALENADTDACKNKSLFCLLHNIVIILLRNKKADELYTEEEKKDVLEKIVAILNLLGPDVIKGYSAANYNHIHKIGYLRLINLNAERDICYIEDHDEKDNSIKFKIASHSSNFPRCYMDGKEFIPSHIKIKKLSILNIDFSYEVYFWVNFTNRKNKISFKNSLPVNILSAGKRLNSDSYANLSAIIERKNTLKIELPAKVKLLRKIASLSQIKNKFRECWVFVDNELRADDNAEHFYRYIKECQPNINAYFLLNKSSSDWGRLKAEGFALIEFGSLQHRLALLNAKFLLSSHANPAIVNYLPRKHFNDIMKYKFVFLQHGVTKDDQSEWLNSRKIDFLVTAGKPEFDDIAMKGRYRYTSKEVILTGFPRYDNLQKLESKRKILIMPTWRKSLAGELLKKSSKRIKNENFNDSEFCKQWGGFLRSDKLKLLVENHDYEVIFLPHPNLVDYLEDLSIPDYIKIESLEKCSIQKLFQETDALITDYSSVAFDVAYMRKPVLYFQFDKNTFFAEHSYSKGYYDYERHGFGEVADNIEHLHNALTKTIENSCKIDDFFERRINAFFPHNDNKNSERLFDRLTSPSLTERSVDVDIQYLNLQMTEKDLTAAEINISNIVLKKTTQTEVENQKLTSVLDELYFWAVLHNNTESLSNIASLSNKISYNIDSLSTYNSERDNSNLIYFINTLQLKNEIHKHEPFKLSLTHYSEHSVIELTFKVINFIQASLDKHYDLAASLFEDMKSEELIKKSESLKILHAINLIKTQKIKEALIQLSKSLLNDLQKSSILMLIFEHYRDEDISSLNLTFLQTLEPTNADKEALLYLNAEVTLSQYEEYFASHRYNHSLFIRYIDKLFNAKHYTPLIESFEKYASNDFHLFENKTLIKYFNSIFLIHGIEQLNSKLMGLFNAECYKSTFDSLFLDGSELTLDIVFSMLEQNIEQDLYSYSSSDVYKYSLYFCKHKRPDFAKKITTLAVMRMHEAFYLDNRNWAGNNDYRTLISAVTELNNAIHELDRIK